MANKILPPTSSLKTDIKYVYLAVSRRRVDRIVATGRLMTSVPSGDNKWDDGSSDPRTYLFVRANLVYRTVNVPTNSAILRLLRRDIRPAPIRSGIPGVLYISKPVLSRYVEILTKRGWAPIDNIDSLGESAVPDQTREALDAATQMYGPRRLSEKSAIQKRRERMIFYALGSSPSPPIPPPPPFGGQG